MNFDRKVSRRLFALGAAGVAGGGVAIRGIAAQGSNLSASISCLCATDNGFAALRSGNRGGPTTLNYAMLQSSSIPTPRAQTLVISQSTNQVWDSFNPYIPNGEAYQYGVNQFCREAPFYVNFSAGKIINWLATGYKYNPDFTEFTVSLNPAAKWSDGQAYSSDDWVYSIGLLQANSNFQGADQVTAYVTSVAASDPETVVFKLKSPNPRFHYNFTVGIVNDPIRIVPKHVWSTQDAGTFKNNPPIYTGPYVLSQAIPDQFMQVWKKADTYWNKANLDPKPEYVVVRQFLPADAEVQDFTSGNVDIPSFANYANFLAIKDSYKTWSELDFADPCPRGVWINQDSPSGLFAKPEGRWALSYLTDRATIGTTIWQPATVPAKYPWADYAINQRWTNPTIQAKYPLDFDLTKAGTLLDSAGATMNGGKRQLNGKDISLTCITPVNVGDPEYQIATLIAQNAKKVGIDIQVKALPGAPFTDAFGTGDYDFTSHWLCGESLDPDQLYTHFLERDYKPVGTVTPQNANETRTQDKALNDSAVKLEGLNPDDTANKAAFDQGLEAYFAALPAFPSIQTIYPLVFSTQYWTGWPTKDNDYNVAANWWAQFLFVGGAIAPATASS